MAEAMTLIQKGIRPAVPPSANDLPDLETLESYKDVLVVYEMCSSRMIFFLSFFHISFHFSPLPLQLNQLTAQMLLL